MSKHRILIVDDEEDIRAIVRATLAVKYDVVEAQDGVDALAKLDLAEPDFVVLDVMMPLMDGYQTCEAIRRHPRFRGLSVLFLSALNSKEDMKKGYGAGANLFLTKPFDPSRLLRNVDLFFETNPPQPHAKRHTLEDLKRLEAEGSEAIATAQAFQSAPLARRTRPAGSNVRLAPEDIETIERPPAAIGQGFVPRPALRPEVSSEEETVRRDPSSARGRPVAGHGAEPGVHSHGHHAPAALQPRVLVVDDDPDLLTIAKANLAGRFEVFSASDGLEAIEKITAYTPDLLVLDAMMPKMSGYQLCQSLRRNARFAKTPIIFLSGKASPRDREYALRIGANDFLAKPYEPAELLARLDALIAAPGFRVLPKALSTEKITDLEQKQMKEIDDHKDRFHIKAESELEKFLRENA